MSSQTNLQASLATMQAAYAAEPYPSYQQRKRLLTALASLLLQNEAAIVAAINRDFGYRCAHETRLAEIFPALAGVRYTRRKLKTWMKPQRRHVAKWYWGAKNRVLPKPLGIVGIIVPWNYPLLLALAPLSDAIAAGNRVMLKMSELSPHLSVLLKDLLARYLGDEWVQVFSDDGQQQLGAEFSSLAFNHLLFTGSTETGKKVMAAAAANLTPVTLELGGKSPVIIADDYPLSTAVSRVLQGKLLNSGQTCIAPDYILLPEGKRDEFVQACHAYCQQHYDDLDDAAISNIIAPAFLRRLKALKQQAVAAGASEVSLIPGAAAAKLSLSLLINVDLESDVMRQEIFGPILPVLEYCDLEQALAFINQRPAPLALYLFSQRSTVQQRVEQNTCSGGLCINDVLLHVAQHDLPFGGVGASGMGHYHGREGFIQFSQLRPVFKQGPFSGAGLLAPPYRRMAEWLLKQMLR